MDALPGRPYEFIDGAIPTVRDSTPSLRTDGEASPICPHPRRDNILLHIIRKSRGRRELTKSIGLRICGLSLIILSLMGCQLFSVDPTPTVEPEVIAPALEFAGVHRLTYDEYYYEHPVWSPDGKTIAVSRNTSNLTTMGVDPYEWEIVLFDLESGEAILVSIGDEFSETSPAFSPDGEQLAFTAYDTEINRQILYSIEDS